MMVRVPREERIVPLIPGRNPSFSVYNDHTRVTKNGHMGQKINLIWALTDEVSYSNMAYDTDVFRMECLQSIKCRYLQKCN